MILMLYPLRMTTRSIVSTDIVHAVPLAAVAGLGHLWMGNVNFPLLGLLLVGSFPGIIVGSLLSGKTPERLLQVILVCILAVVGIRLIGF
jgi:uncharacterized membrane protein YfcA